MNKNTDWLTIARKHGYSMPDARFQNFVAELLESRPAAPVVGEGLREGLEQIEHSMLQARMPGNDKLREINLALDTARYLRAAHPVAPAVVAEGLTDEQIDRMYYEELGASRDMAPIEAVRSLVRRLETGHAAHPVAGSPAEAIVMQRAANKNQEPT